MMRRLVTYAFAIVIALLAVVGGYGLSVALGQGETTGTATFTVTYTIPTVTVTVTAPTTTVPAGVTRDVLAGQSINAAITASSPGDTVLVHAGSYPKLTLTKTFTSPGVTVRGEPGTVIAGVLFQSVGGYTVRDLASTVPNSSDSGFYISGSSHDITIRNVTVRGGWDGIKVYCPAPGNANNITVRDSDIAGAAEDDFHLDGVTNMLIDHNLIHDPADNPDHNDGIQSQRSDRVTISRNTISFASSPPQANGPNNGIILSPVPSLNDTVTNTLIVNNLIAHWNAGRPLQLVGSNHTQIVNNTIVDDGGGSSEPSITINDQFPTAGPNFDNLNVEIWNNIVNKVYITPGFAAPTFFSTNLITNPQPGMLGANAIVANPLFLNTVSYVPSAASPARGVGLTRAGTPTVDLTGAARPSVPGLGARA